MTRTTWCRVLPVFVLVVRAEVAAGQARVPLCVGLTIVGAVSEPEGDYEPMTTVTGIDAEGVHLHYHSEARTPAGSIRKVSVRRTVRRADLENGTLLVPWFSPRASERIPGATAIGVSRSVLRSLKATGTAELGLVDRENSELPAERGVHPNVYDYQADFTLRRVADGPAVEPVLVNGERLSLPVIRARGVLMGDEVELTLLDDETNPLALRTRLGSGGRDAMAASSRAIKISHQCRPSAGAEAPAGRLEQALRTTGRVDVYDLHFDFNSDRMREQSEPTLREIAALLLRHPDWRLAIEGHTDSIASAQFNLELSARRAQAVKSALVSRYGIAERRLMSSGAGEGQPRDRNDTPEGRARNRRVELVRLP